VSFVALIAISECVAILDFDDISSNKFVANTFG